MTPLVLAALAALAIGDPDSETAAAPAQTFDPRAMEVQLADDSILKLLLADERIEIVTPHGTLQVPTDEIRRIEFAQRLPAETTRQVADLIQRLGNSDAEIHEAAAAQLLELKQPAYLALVKAAKG